MKIQLKMKIQNGGNWGFLTSSETYCIYYSWLPKTEILNRRDQLFNFRLRFIQRMLNRYED